MSTVGCTRLCQSLIQRSVHSSAVACVNIRAGKLKPSPGMKKKKITYEVANPPYTIGVKKAWNSWNTSNLHGEGRAPETAFEDVFIRKFITGTMINLLPSEVIIKRRFNMIYITTFVRMPVGGYSRGVSKMYFFIGYCEEMLSVLLKCPVKLELQMVETNELLTFIEI